MEIVLDAPYPVVTNRDQKEIKVVVWDLDNTVWDGILLEDTTVVLRQEVLTTIRELDRRGIIQSIASRNDFGTAMAKLEEFGIHEYFLYPKIGWDNKSDSIRQIARDINVGIDTLAFIDDQPFEREEVSFNCPEVLCLDAVDVPEFLTQPAFNPRFITDESSLRRQLYQMDIKRKEVEDTFTGPKEEFLATLGLKFTLAPATEADLQRAEELTKRTNQLNTTGYTYDYDELLEFIGSPNYELLVASLEDKYGTYGKIGLSLVEKRDGHWLVKLLLMSCRVMSRGVGTIMINHLVRSAREAGVTLRAEFIRTDRNRAMFITYRLGNFSVIHEDGSSVLLENDCTSIPPNPSHVEVIIGERK